MHWNQNFINEANYESTVDYINGDNLTWELVYRDELYDPEGTVYSKIELINK